MARPLWSGSISFGLVNIPVSLFTTKEGDPIHFHMLDKKDYSRIGYKTYNKTTGKEISRDQIVKAFEYEPGQFVEITDKDMEKANPRATRTIDIEDFVDLAEVDTMLFEKPYYVVPSKGGEKGYLLLRRVMEQTDKVAIGRFVLRQKQKLVALMVHGDWLVLETLRYAREVLSTSEFGEVHDKLRDVKVSTKELQMAEELVGGMSSKWDPDKYHDTYYDDLMKMIRYKVKTGHAIESTDLEETERASRGRVVDLMPLLKKSLDVAKKRPNAKSKSPGKGKSRKHADHHRSA